MKSPLPQGGDFVIDRGFGLRSNGAPFSREAAMTLPVPSLDHVVINARDDMDAAAAIYRRLGFRLTPRGFHSLGSTNHLAMFATDYLELIAVPRGATSGRLDLLDWPAGLNGLVFGTEDSAAVYA